MSEQIKFFLSFRARLMLLLSSVLLLTIALVIALDSWVAARTSKEVDLRSQQVKDAVNDGFTDFALAMGMAVHNLSSELEGDDIL